MLRIGRRQFRLKPGLQQHYQPAADACNREVGRVTKYSIPCSARSRRTFGTRQEMMEMNRPGQVRIIATARDARGIARHNLPGNAPGNARLSPSLHVQACKTIRHPTDAAALPVDPGRRKPPEIIAAIGRSGALPKCGPSCFQDPLGALGDGDHPPIQNQDQLCQNQRWHPLNLTRQLVLSVKSRTSRKLAIRYAPALQGNSPQAP